MDSMNSNEMISEQQIKIRKQIFFLLVQLDPKVKDKNENVDIEKAFTTLLYRLHKINAICDTDNTVDKIIKLLEEALKIYRSEQFEFSVYRKLLLDAGDLVAHMKVGD